MKKVKKIEFINDYNRMSLEAMAKEYGVKSSTIEKYGKVLGLKDKRKHKTKNYHLITDLNEKELERFKTITYGKGKTWKERYIQKNVLEQENNQNKDTQKETEPEAEAVISLPPARKTGMWPIGRK